MLVIKIPLGWWMRAFGKPCPIFACGTVEYCQSTSVLIKAGVKAGASVIDVWGPPASSRRTRRLGLAASRLATTAPALPVSNYIQLVFTSSETNIACLTWANDNVVIWRVESCSIYILVVCDLSLQRYYRNGEQLCGQTDCGWHDEVMCCPNLVFKQIALILNQYLYISSMLSLVCTKLSPHKLLNAATMACNLWALTDNELSPFGEL